MAEKASTSESKAKSVPVVPVPVRVPVPVPVPVPEPEPANQFGEAIKYDPDFKGPLGRRSCTDVFCLGLFIVFLLCWMAIGIYAFIVGNSDLLVPRDSDGRVCGHDPEVEDNKYLVYFDITKCLGPQVLFAGCDTPQVCVEKCPSSNYYYGLETSPAIDKSNIVCVSGVAPTDKKSMEAAVDANKCAKYTIASEPVLDRCLPHVDENFLALLNVSVSQLSSAVENIEKLAGTWQIITVVTQDLTQCWWKILLFLLLATAVCLLYIYVLTWIAGCVVWFSIFGFIVLLVVGVAITSLKYISLLKSNETKEKNLWLVLLIIASGFLIFILRLVSYFLRKRFDFSINQGTGNAVRTVTSSLFFPICSLILQVLVIAYAVNVGLYLNSITVAQYKIQGAPDKGCVCGKEKIQYNNNETCDINTFDCSAEIQTVCPNIACSLDQVIIPNYVYALHTYNVIGGFWGVFFFFAFEEMVLATAFATWYWTFTKSEVPFFTLANSMLLTVKYHVGTLAFGSLFLKICRLNRIDVEYLNLELKKCSNPCAKAMMCYNKCSQWCLNEFLIFVNKNEYIMCAIHGTNFCLSSKNAFQLIMRSILRGIVVVHIIELWLFLSKIVITVLVGVIAHAVFKSTEHLHYDLVPVFVIVIGTYIIASAFFAVYTMAMDTILICFHEDCERNDGSKQRPYYMSKELELILGKIK